MLWSDTSRPSGFSRGLCREEGGSEPKGGEEGGGEKETPKKGGVRQMWGEDRQTGGR